MERLTLTGRPKTGDKLKCLPAGDGLPIWSTLPLDAKLPMMDNPKGSVVLYTTKLGEPVSYLNINFMEKWNFEGTYVVSSYIEKEM